MTSTVDEFELGGSGSDALARLPARRRRSGGPAVWVVLAAALVAGGALVAEPLPRIW